jgi:hypothetical protein
MNISIETLILKIKNAIELYRLFSDAVAAGDHIFARPIVPHTSVPNPWPNRKMPTPCLPNAAANLRASANNLICHLEMVGGDAVAATVKDLDESLNGPRFVPPRLT